jgi:hypothetical protein
MRMVLDQLRPPVKAPPLSQAMVDTGRPNKSDRRVMSYVRHRTRCTSERHPHIQVELYVARLPLGFALDSASLSPFYFNGDTDYVPLTPFRLNDVCPGAIQTKFTAEAKHSHVN